MVIFSGWLQNPAPRANPAPRVTEFAPTLKGVKGGLGVTFFSHIEFGNPLRYKKLIRQKKIGKKFKNKKVPRVRF